MVSSLDKLYEDSGFVVLGSGIESGKGEFVEVLGDPTCLLQWERLAEGEVGNRFTHLGGCTLFSLFAFLLFPLGFETF